MENDDVVMSVLKLDEKSNSSHDDPNRLELLWDNKIEAQIIKWRDEMSVNEKLHTIYGRKFKKLHNMFAIPNIIIPLILSALMKQLDEQDLVVSLLLISSGIFSGISHLMGFSKRSQRHFEVGNSLSKMVKEIELELSKPKKMRISADVYLERTYNHYTSILDLAPDARSVAMKTRTIKKK